MAKTVSTIGALIRKRIMQQAGRNRRLTDQDIVKEVRRTFRGSTTSVKSVQNTRHQLRLEGHEIPDRRSA